MNKNLNGNDQLPQPVMFYLCPERLITFDGFVSYEGRRFGVPYWYTKKVCRIQRSEYTITIYDEDLSRVLTTHDVTWSRRDSCCRDQYVTSQPEELRHRSARTDCRGSSGTIYRQS